VTQTCARNPSTGQEVVGPETVTFVLTFSPDGRHVTADERKTFSSPCQYRYGTTRWRADWISGNSTPIV
jgi:hypothetical protein